MKPRGTLALFCEAGRELLFPSRATCLGCESRLGSETDFLCAECAAKLVPLYRKSDCLCPRCGTPLDSGRSCDLCAAWPPFKPSRVRYAYFYEPPIDGLIRHLKYGGVYRLAPLLSKHLAALIEASGLQRADCLIPVPMHRSRLLERGFNQAAVLAEAVSKETGIALLESALTRVRNTRQQARLGGEMRRLNLEAAFRASSAVRGKRVLLIDDVLTTGETILRCAAALYEAGAWDVQAATLAGPRPRNFF